jgi:hypothetical protein
LAEESLKDRVKHRHELAINRRLPTNGDSSVNKDSSAKTTDLRALKQFLSNPFEYHLRRTLGIWNDDDTGDMTATDEPLDSGNNISALRKKVWIDILNIIFKDTGTESILSPESVIQSAVDAAEKIADDIYKDHINSGQAPEGHICYMEQEELKTWAKKCAAASGALLNDFPNHRFKDMRHLSDDEPPALLSCGDFTINVRHDFTVTNNQQNKIGAIAFDKAVKPEDNIRLWLDGLMMWLDEMRNGGKRRQAVIVTLNHDDKPKVQTSYMSTDDTKLQDVEKWLTDMLTQMLIDKRCEHLPFKVIADIRKRDEELTVRSLKDHLAGYKTYTEAFDLTDANSKPTEMDDGELREIAGSRYAPILKRWIHG